METTTRRRTNSPTTTATTRRTTSKKTTDCSTDNRSTDYCFHYSGVASTSCCRLKFDLKNKNKRGQQQPLVLHQHSQHPFRSSGNLVAGCLLLALPTLCLILGVAELSGATVGAAAATDGGSSGASASLNEQQQQHETTGNSENRLAGFKTNTNQQQQQNQRALEAELNSIVQQHDALEGNNKLLAEAIISRLMVDNLTTGSNQMIGGGGSGPNNELFENELLDGGGERELLQTNNAGAGTSSGGATIVELLPGEQQALVGGGGVGNNQAPVSASAAGSGNAYDAMRLRRLLSFLQNIEPSSSGTIYAQYPILPSSQAATMKRAAAKMGSYMQPRAASAYARNQFDFGLGKRVPDTYLSSLISSPESGSGNVLRFGDSSIGLNGGSNIQPVSQFGKRPSAHRYDFGLGKRVASPAYPRYDFGLGKRAPNRIRYDFGLGRK